MRTLLLLAGWFFLAIWMGASGVLVPGAAPPFALLATIVLPLLLFELDSRFGSPLFGGLLRLDLPALIALQTFRILGIIFVVAWHSGTLPAGFALPAGLGDVAVGLSAPFVDPLSLIPSFLVPLALLLHIRVFRELSKTRPVLPVT